MDEHYPGLELSKTGYVDCNFNWTNIDLSPDERVGVYQEESGYHEVADISQNEIYQFDVSSHNTVFPNTTYSYESNPGPGQVELTPQLPPPDYPMQYTPGPAEYTPPSKKGKGGRKKSLRPPSPSILKLRREAANARERKRMNGLNDAFERLREVVPNLTTEQKMSKIETLHMAQTYIKALAGLIDREEKRERGEPYLESESYSALELGTNYSDIKDELEGSDHSILPE